MRQAFISTLLVILLSNAALAAIEINTTLAQYTYKIEGPTEKPNIVTRGTVFIMGIPNPDRPGKGRILLVTAAHVLKNISGPKAKIYLRQKLAKGKYKKVPRELIIREDNKPLWTPHPEVDIAVMKISLPIFIFEQAKDMPLLSTDLFADDAIMEKFEIHPGDELLCLGYPKGAEANPAGFPILRGGRIASFPLTPVKDIKSFLFDFQIYGGNSGGPVYFVDKNRRYGGRMHLGETIQCVIGVVTQQKYAIHHLSEKQFKMTKLNLAGVVPAYFIKETIDILMKKESN